MTITGSIGQRKEHEAFGENYDDWWLGALDKPLSATER
jgi:hypothetical protein